ncbi:MAG TPA: sigma 54-interacting transcriptional regulator [Polyangiaceae bacterium]|nr:sigma 54-interacting transcriptional regulator [Polyangiaceae bacterium]
MGKPNSEAELATVEQSRPDSGGAIVPFRIEVTEGPDKGKTFSIESGRALIGVSATCDLRLTDRRVSRRHLALDVDGRRLRLADLGSTNGTTVNDIVANDVSLLGGETIRIGGTALTVTRGQARPAEAPKRARFGRLIGASSAMQVVLESAERLASVMAPTLIEGEPGTGTELTAEVLHEMGPRSAGPFVVFSASDAVPSRAKSELFGDDGAFASAVGGTLLVDEVADLPAEAQEALADWIDRRGATTPAAQLKSSLDVRLIATSSRDLDREVQAGRFSARLLELLAAARLELPPLRRRDGDIALLAERFWADLGGEAGALEPATIAKLADRAWAGNVAELRAEVARLVMASLADVEPKESIEEVLALDLPFSQARHRALMEFERRYVERVLAKHSGNVSRAAQASGIARRYFQIVKARQGGGAKPSAPPASDRPR